MLSTGFAFYGGPKARRKVPNLLNEIVRELERLVTKLKPERCKLASFERWEGQTFVRLQLETRLDAVPLQLLLNSGDDLSCLRFNLRLRRVLVQAYAD